MAWNKPNSNTVDATSSSRSAGRGKMPRLRKGLLAGVIVVLGSGIAAWLLSSGEATSSSLQKKDRGLIKEVTPAAAPTNKVEAVAKKEARVPFWKFDASQTNKLSAVELRKWELANRPRRPVAPREYRKEKYEIFNHRSENQIAGLLTHEPGRGLIGRPIFDDDAFEKDFLKSCEEPIVNNPDDDDYSKELKDLMRKTKIDLRQRMADGEKLSDILYAAHEELQRLGMVKASIEMDVRKMVEENATSANDIDLFFEAANKMLEQKGIAPLKQNPILRRSLVRMINKKETKK